MTALRQLPRVTIAFIAVSLAAASAASGQTDRSGKIYRLGLLTMGDPVSGPIRTITVPELARNGFVEGKNLVIEVESGPAERMSELARRLVARQPDVIIADSDWAVRPALAATRTIPVVMSPMGQDPVAAGVAASWARPGGNATGVTLLAPELESKRLELLLEAIPGVSRIAVLTMHETPNRELRAAAALSRIQLIERSVSGPGEYRDAIETMRAAGAEALVIVPTPELYRDSATLAQLATAAQLPAVCGHPELAERGGCLIGYGPDLVELRRRTAEYVARLFDGGRAGEMPIEGPARFRLATNLKMARALGLSIPSAFLARADEVID